MLRTGLGTKRTARTSATISVPTPPTPSDTTPPVITGLSYSGGNATFTLSEAATTFLLFRTSSSPIAFGSFSAVMAGALVADSFSASAGANTRAISISALTVGTWYLHAVAQDAAGNSTLVSSVSAGVVIAAPGSPPVHVAPLAPRFMEQGSGTVTFATAACFTGATSYSLVSPPAGVTINSTTGVVSVNVLAVIDATFTVRATNSGGDTDVPQFVMVLKTPDLWVDPVAGNDTTGTGTFAAPFQTLNKARDTLSGSGKRIAIRAGTIAVTATQNPWCSGIAGAHNVISAYNNEAVIFDGAGLTSGNVFYMYGYTTLANVAVRNNPITAGIGTWNTGNIRVVGCDVSGHKKGGIYFGGDTTITANHVIEWNKIHGNVTENSARAMSSGWAVACALSRQNDSVVQYNWVYQNYGEGIGFLSMLRSDARSNWVYDCFSVGMYLDNVAGQSGNTVDITGNRVFDTGNTAFYRNRSYPSAGTFLPMDGILAANEASAPVQIQTDYLNATGNTLCGVTGPTYGSFGGGTYNTVGTHSVMAPNVSMAQGNHLAGWVQPVVVADTTAPVITELAFTDGNASARMDEAGTVYYLFSTSATPIAQSAFAVAMSSALVSGSFAAIVGENVASVNPAALTAGTWYFHTIGQDASGNRTAVSVVSGSYGVAGAGPVVVASTKLTTSNYPTGTIAKPTGTANGHMMVLIIGVKAQATPVTPTGWTLIGSDIANGANNTGLFAYKRVASSEPATYDLDMGGYFTWSAAITTYSNCSAVGSLTSTHNSYTQNLTGPTITATGNSLIETIGAFDQDTITAPSGTTLDQQTTTAAGYTGITVVHEGPVIAGTTTARTFNGSTPGSSAVVGVLEIKV
ncbi:MAG: hypothetical protein JWQ44_2928 [Chthoniobacter sp.]|nr:hypothetical protein [Chthoniobacter sp.]